MANIEILRTLAPNLGDTYSAHLSVRSENIKTGPIPVTTMTAITCPIRCPHRGTTCYAELGKMALWWERVTMVAAGASWEDVCAQIAALPAGQLWRHAQAGDLPGDGIRIDREALRLLTSANRGKRGFTYTHYSVTPSEHGLAVALHNAVCIREAISGGFAINVSCETMAQVDHATRLGFPTAVVMPTTWDRVNGGSGRSVTPEGVVVTQCPAQYRETGPGSSCATCSLCQRVSRTACVGFAAHGARKGTIDKRAALFKAEGLEPLN